MPVLVADYVDRLHARERKIVFRTRKREEIKRREESLQNMKLE